MVATELQALVMEARADMEIGKTLAETTHTAVVEDMAVTILRQLLLRLRQQSRLERPAQLPERTMQLSMPSIMEVKIRMRRMAVMLHMLHITSIMLLSKLEPEVLRVQRLALLQPRMHLHHLLVRHLRHPQGLDLRPHQDHHLEMEVTMR